MPVFTLKCFSANLFSSLVFYFIAKKQNKKQKKMKKHPSSLPPANFSQKCNPLRLAVGNAMYPDHEV